ncbi:MAG TPA: tyrosinase family protein [Vicinamibacterales bacterium]
MAELTAAERTAFVNAVLALKAAPSRIAAAATAVTAGGGTPNRYDDYVWMHSTVGAGAHFGPAFGPWHREFLRQFEFDLRQVSGNPHIVIPYWDWTTGRTAGDPNWPFTDDLVGPLGDAAGVVASGPFSNPATWRMNIRRQVFRADGLAQVPDNNLVLRRRPAAVAAGFNLPIAATARSGVALGVSYDVAPFNEFPAFQALINSGATQAQLNAQLTTWTNASFRKFLEWRLHNGPHTWIGGQDNWAAGAAPTFVAGPMSIPAVAVNDPVFWLHHCNVDRLWSAWQQRNPPGSYAPASGADPGHNNADQMVHFEAASAANFNTTVRSTPADLVNSRGVLDIWYTSDLPIITLVTPSVDFGDVPAGLTTDWPVKFDVRTCRRVKFRVTAIGGANFSIPPGVGDVFAEHHDVNDPVRANVFIEYVGLGAANVSQPGTATIGAFIDDVEGYYTGTVGGEHQVGTFSITLTARTVPAPRAAVTLVLDRSGSMSESAGPAGTKYDLLQSALRVVSALMRSDDAIGLVSYDDVIATLTASMLQMGTVTPAGAGRAAIEAAITSGNLAPRGLTAIGQGMISGAAVLSTVQSDTNYATKAMVVMTDGNENVDPRVTDPSVQSAIAWFSDRVYAIGLGAETNVSAPTLGAIARYQLITGNITTHEQRFLLTKYFLQILAQVTDSAIVVDPMGELRPGDTHRVSFDLAESDVSIDVVAICPIAALLDLTLEAPDGTAIDMSSGPNVAFQLDAGDEFYRVKLPALAANAAGTHGGRWTAVLRIRDLKSSSAAALVRRSDAAATRFGNIDRQALQSVAQRGALPYQVFVQSYSSLKMTVELQQSSFLPGATLTFVASLKEYRIPVVGPARVVVEVVTPDGGEIAVQLSEVSQGQFTGSHVATMTGVYQCRFRANGTSRGGHAFQREETRTAAINARLGPGGDLSRPGQPGGDDDSRRWCALLSCLLRQPSIRKWLDRHDIEMSELSACLQRFCGRSRMSERDLAAALAPRLEEDAMSDEDTKRLRSELAALRAELKKDAAIGNAPWDDLLSPAPRPARVRPMGSRAPLKAAADEHEAHHTLALPALVTDDEGNTSVVVPPGHEAAAAHEHKRDHHKDHGDHEHAGHDHGTHDHGTRDHDDHDADTHDDHGGGGHDHGGRDAGKRPKKKS